MSNPDDFDFIEPAEEVLPANLIADTTTELDDFDFIDHYGEDEEVNHENLLPENTIPASLNCAVIGVGGGGGKMAKAFLDLGYNKTLLVNTTAKDIPDDVDDNHVVLIPDADGIGKDVNLGKAVFEANSAVVEDALRTKLGNVDWLFVLVEVEVVLVPPACHYIAYFRDTLSRFRLQARSYILLPGQLHKSV